MSVHDEDYFSYKLLFFLECINKIRTDGISIGEIQERDDCEDNGKIYFKE
jgi:hypothetical protein